MSEGRYDGVIAQAEDLILRQREAYEAALREREMKRKAWDDAQAARINFLKTVDAAPMEVADYDEWLTNFVANGGTLTNFVQGSFPRIRMFDEGAGEVVAALVQQQGTLEEAYYGEPVIWTVDQAVELRQIPKLVAEQCVTLHLTRNAVRNISRAQIEAWAITGAAGDNEVYIDGYWADGEWVAAAYVVRAIPYVWEENLLNMNAVFAI